MSFKPPFKPSYRSKLGDFATQVEMGAAPLSRQYSQSPPKPIPDNPFRNGLSPMQNITAEDVAAKEYYELAKRKYATGVDFAVSGVKDELTERAAAKVLGGTIVKAAGAIAIPFALADLFDVLAPGVKSWLQGGWKGLQGQGLPQTKGALMDAQGQCSTNYLICCTYQIPSQGNFTFTRCGEVTGPLDSYDVRYIPTSGTDGFWRIFATRRGMAERAVFHDEQPSSSRNFLGFSIKREDNGLDACGQTQGPDTPAPQVANPKPTGSNYRPQPSRPVPATANFPSTQALADIPTSGVPKAAPGNPLSRPTPSDSPSASKPGSLTRPAPQYEGTPPKNPTEPLSPSNGCSPCDLKIGDKLDELRDKLDEVAEKVEEKESPSCQYYRFDYVSVTCTDGKLRLTPRFLRLDSPPTQALRDEFDALAQLAAKGCESDPVASIPDWWQVRLGATRPQIVVAYRKEDTGTYHQISIPHPNQTAKWTENLLGDYRKGPYAGILTLTDNSKFIVNCETEAEAWRMIAKAKTIINPVYLGSGMTEQVTKRAGKAVAPASLYGRTAAYFPSGQEKSVPEWRATFGVVYRI
jgi:hypothetical protein